MTLWVDVLSFSATLLVVFRLSSLGENTPINSIYGILKNMKDGSSWLITNRLHLTLTIQAMVGNFGHSVASALLMYFLLSELQLEEFQISVNYALIGLGGLLGSIIVVPLERCFRRGVLIPLLLGVGAIGFFIPLLTNFWLGPGLAFAIVAICNVAWTTMVQSLRQETVPSDMLGRVLGFSRMTTRLAMPLGAMVGAFS